jgi:hypothetical protein
MQFPGGVSFCIRLGSLGCDCLKNMYWVIGKLVVEIKKTDSKSLANMMCFGCW